MSIRNIVLGFYSHFLKNPDLLQTEMAVIGYWYITWKYRGWEPILLTAKDIDWNEQENRKFLSIVKQHPSDFNHREYNLACWLRWIAFRQFHKRNVDPNKHIFCGDYDIFNYGLEPNNKALDKYLSMNICSFTEGWGCCLANYKGITDFCEACQNVTSEAIVTGKRFGTDPNKKYTIDLFVAAFQLNYLQSGQMRIMDEEICKYLINGAHNLTEKRCEEWKEEYNRNHFMRHMNKIELETNIAPMPMEPLTMKASEI